MTSAETSAHLTRLTPDGAVDESFGAGGVVDVGTQARGFALDSRQRLILSTFDAVLRLLPTGARDSSWGSGGEVALRLVQGAVPDRQDRMLVADIPSGTLRYFRLDENGSWDTSFPILAASERSGVKRIAADGTDGAWVVTRSCYGRGCYNSFAHVRADGTYGPDFGSRFYPRGPLLTTGGGAVLVGGSLRVGAPHSRDTATITAGSRRARSTTVSGSAVTPICTRVGAGLRLRDGGRCVGPHGRGDDPL